VAIQEKVVIGVVIPGDVVMEAADPLEAGK
jgi:hypothetical protein